MPCPETLLLRAKPYKAALATRGGSPIHCVLSFERSRFNGSDESNGSNQRLVG